MHRCSSAVSLLGGCACQHSFSVWRSILLTPPGASDRASQLLALWAGVSGLSVCFEKGPCVLVLLFSQESCHCLKEKVLPPSFSGSSLPLFLPWVKRNRHCHYCGLHQICLVANISQLERQNPKTGGCPFLGKKTRDPGRCPELYWAMAAMSGPRLSPGSALSQSHRTFEALLPVQPMQVHTGKLRPAVLFRGQVPPRNTTFLAPGGPGLQLALGQTHILQAKDTEGASNQAPTGCWGASADSPEEDWPWMRGRVPTRELPALQAWPLHTLHCFFCCCFLLFVFFTGYWHKGPREC